jgi:RNA polymerase sigma factor (sigma-70 family)
MENSENHHPDNELLLRFCNHHRPAVQRLYDDCFDDIKKMVKKYRGKEEDAEDVFQEGMLILLTYCKRSSFVLTTPLCGFLYSICAKFWWKKLKKSERLEITFKDFSEYINLKHVIALQEEEELKAQRLRLIWKHLRLMPEIQQHVLRLFYLEGKSHSEIAETVGFADENSAKVQKFKYLKHLIAQTREDPDFG